MPELAPELAIVVDNTTRPAAISPSEIDSALFIVLISSEESDKLQFVVVPTI
jgi:hypothetical protein